MASLYTRKGSPFFWVEYRDSRGLRRQESTGCRTSDSREVRRAKRLAAQRTMEELGGAESKKSDWGWVSDFFRIRYASNESTLTRYVTTWQTIQLFLSERKILSPQQLTRSHCFDYVTWREHSDMPNGKYRACHNTALYDLRVLSLVMHEAVVREFVSGNPCVKLGIKKLPVKQKPLLTEDDCRRISDEVGRVKNDNLREFYFNSFTVARYQGCRLVETRVNPFLDVNITTKPDGTNSGTIRFRAKRGDFTTLLHPVLVPFFERLRDEGKQSTWNPPAKYANTKIRTSTWASNQWRDLFRRIGMKGVSFHCTRVLVVTEMARNNVPESKAKAYVGHASSTVHRIYQRLQIGDLQDCVAVVGGTRPSSSNSGSTDAK